VAEIRGFEPDDAESVVSLLATLTPAFVHTAESLRWRERAEPQRQSWVAAEDGELVGFATSFLQLWTAVQGLVRVSAYVKEDRRRRGIGSALWEQVLSHARNASKFTTEVENDPAGLAFVEHRGFTQYDSEVITRLDPAACTLEPKPHEGFRIVGLQELGGREQELFEFYGAAGGIPAGAPITFEHFRTFILGNPTLDPPTSVVVFDDDAGAARPRARTPRQTRVDQTGRGDGNPRDLHRERPQQRADAGAQPPSRLRGAVHPEGPRTA
jgi:GNAT superfamily N-acetyltransferase